MTRLEKTALLSPILAYAIYLLCSAFLVERHAHPVTFGVDVTYAALVILGGMAAVLFGRVSLTKGAVALWFLNFHLAGRDFFLLEMELPNLTGWRHDLAIATLVIMAMLLATSLAVTVLQVKRKFFTVAA